MFILATATDAAETGTDWSRIIWITALVSLAVLVVSAGIITRKAGYSYWLGLLAVVIPIFAPLIALWLALVKWPALKERDEAFKMLEKAGYTVPRKPKKIKRIVPPPAPTAVEAPAAAAPTTPTLTEGRPLSDDTTRDNTKD